jgi:hypothetical protein
MMYSDPDGLVAGLVVRVGLRYALPRLGAQLGARAATRATRAKLVQHVVVKGARLADRGPLGCGYIAKKLVSELSMSPAGQRALLRNAMGANGTGKVAHHVVPLEAAKRFPELMRRAAQAGFNINGRNNGALLDAANHVGGHPMYNRAVMEQLGRFNPGLSPARAARELQRVSDTLQNSIMSGRFGPWG